MFIRLAVAFGIALAMPGSATLAGPISATAQGAEGLDLHYLDFGGRGTPIILLAGAGNSAWIYGDFGTMLAKRHRVYAVTRRGHGTSGSPAKGYTIDLMVEDLRRFMDQRGIKRAVLIGHSLGGAELTRFAGTYPDRVSALVYLDAAYDRSTQGKTLASDPLDQEAPTAADRASVEAFVAHVRRTRPDLRRYWTADVDRDLRASIAMRPDGTAGWVTSAMFGEYWTSASATAPDYAAVKAPALALYSVEDESYRLPTDATAKLRAEYRAFELGPLATWRNASAAQFRVRSANREMVEVDGGHHLFIHRPAKTLALVEAFLKRHKIN